ncbi:hypothetical protein CBL_02868 [Carabus blaptoides fortunei]
MTDQLVQYLIIKPNAVEPQEMEIKWTTNNTKIFLDHYKEKRKQVGTLKTKSLKIMWQQISVELSNTLNKKIGAGKKRNVFPEILLDSNTIHIPEIQQDVGNGKVPTSQAETQKATVACTSETETSSSHGKQRDDGTHKKVKRLRKTVLENFKSLSHHVCLNDQKVSTCLQSVLSCFRDMCGQDAAIQNILADYEAGWRNAVSVLFPNQNLHGCWFHYCKNVYKRARAFNLMHQDADPVARKIVKLSMALPLLPANSIEDRIIYLRGMSEGVPSGRFVLKLCDPLPRGTTVYTDRYLTSVNLIDTLLTRSIGLTGTFMKSRILKKLRFTFDNKMKKAGRGTDVQGSQPEGNCRRWSKPDSEYIQVKQQYGGIDLLDRVIGKYAMRYRTNKWTIRAIYHFIDFAVAAGWLIYRKYAELQDLQKKRHHRLLGLQVSCCRTTTGAISRDIYGRPTAKRKCWMRDTSRTREW